MKLPRVFSVLVGAVFLCFTPRHVEAAPGKHPTTPPQLESPAAAVAEADHLSSTEPGKTYFGSLFPVVHRVLMDAFHDYAGSRHVPSYHVDVVFVLSADGRVERVLSTPDHPILTYLRARLPATRFPPPPRGGWLVHAVSEARG